MPFKSVINEYYARDISKKIKSAYRAQARKGAFIGNFAPYGYMKNPADKYQLIPNPDTMHHLKRIFEMAAEGISTTRIAQALSDDKVLIPLAYVRNNYGHTLRETVYRDDTDWSASSIRGFLTNQVYIGHMVSGKSATQSFKSKKQRRTPEEEHIVVENTHEPLVDFETFEQVRRFLSQKKPGNSRGFDNIFQGMLKCSDCGGGFSINADSFSYNCSRQRHKYCSNHHISYKNLYAIVLGEVQKKLAFVKEHESELAEYAQKLAGQATARDLKHIRGELNRSQKRCEELDVLILRLIEQNALGLLTNERFVSVSSTYETEQKQLKEKITQLQARVDAQSEGCQNAIRFFELVRKYTEIDKLDLRTLRDLVDSVVIYQPQGLGKARTQKVVVNFRFIKDNWFKD